MQRQEFLDSRKRKEPLQLKFSREKDTNKCRPNVRFQKQWQSPREQFWTQTREVETLKIAILRLRQDHLFKRRRWRIRGPDRHATRRVLHHAPK